MNVLKGILEAVIKFIRERMGIVTKEEAIKMFRVIASEMLGIDAFKPGFPDWNGIHVKGLQMKPYQQKYPGGTDAWLTWCNQGAFYILENLGYDLTAVYYQNNCNTAPATLYDNSDIASKDPKTGVTEESLESAISLAKRGIPVLAVAKEGWGHVGLFDPSSTDDEPMIMQTGADIVRGIHSLNDSFIKYGLTPRFYRFPRKPEGVGSQFQYWF